MKTVFILILTLVYNCSAWCEDTLVGKWDYVSEASVLLSNNERPFILEGAPLNTFIEFKDGMYNLFRDDILVYQTPYEFKSVDGKIVDVIIDPAGMNIIHKVYVNNNTLQATVTKKIEYVYKKCG